MFFVITKRSYLTQNESENMCVFYGIYRICRWVLSVQRIWCWQSQGIDYAALKLRMIRMVYLEHVVVCHDANFVVVVVIGIFRFIGTENSTGYLRLRYADGTESTDISTEYSGNTPHRASWNGWLSASMILCAGNSMVTGGYTHKGSVIRSFSGIFDICMIKPLGKHSGVWSN